MVELKVVSKKYNDEDVLEVENFEQAIEADKDVISKITKKYDEEVDLTTIIFPKGIMPLTFGLNTHQLYLKDGEIVDSNGDEVEGYQLDDYYLESGSCTLVVVGDISEQVISDLLYISFDGYPELIANTYYLLFPKKAGTKLYEHIISFDSNAITGNGACGINPIYIISSRKEPYKLDVDVNDYVGATILSLADENSVLGSGFTISGGEITILDYVGEQKSINSVTNFDDSVTEL